MLTALLCLLGCQLAGELIRMAAFLPIPGPVIGLYLLTAILAIRSRMTGAPIPPALDRTAETLISLMGLLFVPAGVGLIAEVHLLRTEWLPILAGLLGSAVLSTAATGMVVERVMRASRATRTRAGFRAPRRAPS